MSRTPLPSSRKRTRAAAAALLLIVVLLGTEFEVVTHRHGDAGFRDGGISLLATPDRTDPERPCSICRLADAPSQAAPDPVCVSAPTGRPGDALPQAAVAVVAGPGPLRSSRAPPRSPSC